MDTAAITVYNAPKLMRHLMWQGNAPEHTTSANDSRA